MGKLYFGAEGFPSSDSVFSKTPNPQIIRAGGSWHGAHTITNHS
ncbi:hypothetical protein NC99_04820 [Sunxiuqinia dokdonensis]|uniref:Uncharacterized protein n=1 Tax=Sunxiuqinia dokdonensis TaxID=1409788 RepID=A0A0L8VES9_9BACT|nr:hypothetical protein NC99_04820 [Sunxiuqinia dokdonensis]